jgi:hypothetical protein
MSRVCRAQNFRPALDPWSESYFQWNFFYPPYLNRWLAHPTYFSSHPDSDPGAARQRGNLSALYSPPAIFSSKGRARVPFAHPLATSLQRSYHNHVTLGFYSWLNDLNLILAMPERVGDYYNLMPLDSSQANVPHKSRTFRYQTISYKATHIRTNAICYLKRMMGMSLFVVYKILNILF